jgi:hypothetical protein
MKFVSVPNTALAVRCEGNGNILPMYWKSPRNEGKEPAKPLWLKLISTAMANHVV